jgi:hypothetical protein
MSPKKYRPFPQYIPAKDQLIMFVRYSQLGAGVLGRWSSASGNFEDADENISCAPETIVEWHPATGYEFPEPKLFWWFAGDINTQEIAWAIFGGRNVTCHVEESEDGGATWPYWFVENVKQQLWPVPDTGQQYRLVINADGIDTIYSDIFQS